MQHNPTWMSDEDATECCDCEKPFTVVRRRHHCRACGKLFCNSCSRRRLVLRHLGYQTPQRVCQGCDLSAPSPVDRWRHDEIFAAAGEDARSTVSVVRGRSPVPRSPRARGMEAPTPVRTPRSRAVSPRGSMQFFNPPIALTHTRSNVSSVLGQTQAQIWSSDDPRSPTLALNRDHSPSDDDASFDGSEFCLLSTPTRETTKATDSFDVVRQSSQATSGGTQAIRRLFRPAVSLNNGRTSPNGRNSPYGPDDGSRKVARRQAISPAGWRQDSGEVPIESLYEVKLTVHACRAVGKRKQCFTAAAMCGSEVATPSVKTDDGICTWDEAFFMLCTDPAADLFLSVFSADTLIGRACLPIALLFEQDNWRYDRLWLELLPPPSGIKDRLHAHKYQAPHPRIPRGELPGTMKRPRNSLGFLCVSVSFSRPPFCGPVAWLTAPGELSDYMRQPHEKNWETSIIAYHGHRIHQAWEDLTSSTLFVWMAERPMRQRVAVAIWGLLCWTADLSHAPVILASLVVINGIVSGHILAGQRERVMVFQDDNELGTVKPNFASRVRNATQIPQRISERMCKIQEYLNFLATFMEKLQYIFAYSCDPTAAAASSLLLFVLAITLGLLLHFVPARAVVFYLGNRVLLINSKSPLSFDEAAQKIGARVRLFPEGCHDRRCSGIVKGKDDKGLLVAWDPPNKGGPRPREGKSVAREVAVERKWWDGKGRAALLDNSWESWVRETRWTWILRMERLSHIALVEVFIHNLWCRIPNTPELEHRLISKSQQMIFEPSQAVVPQLPPGAIVNGGAHGPGHRTDFHTPKAGQRSRSTSFSMVQDDTDSPRDRTRRARAGTQGHRF
eukprot:Hpha_TRINITY_DN457_c0_g1::TRINITY_DN457_c0_g1_i1::g.27523::m.27523